jgi:hypothetical protein
VDRLIGPFTAAGLALAISGNRSRQAGGRAKQHVVAHLGFT